MNREDRFIKYLEDLKTDGNAELLESISAGFKTLVEYRVCGTPSEKVVDIMESEDEIDDSMVDDIVAEDPESADEMLLESEDMDMDKLQSSRFALTPELFDKIDKSGKMQEFLGFTGVSHDEDDNIGWQEELGMDMDRVYYECKDNVEPYTVTPNLLHRAGLSDEQIIAVLELCGSDSLTESSDVKSKIYGKNSDEARHAKWLEKQKEGVASGIRRAGLNAGAAAEIWNRQQERYGKKRLDESEEDGTSEETNSVVMEVGEGEVKGQLTPAILRAVDDAVEAKIRKMSEMIDKQKLVSSDEQKKKYLTGMRGQLWRDSLLDQGIDPKQAKGLVPVMTESIEEANIALLDFVDTAFKIFSIDKGE
jgi:hypothetical protein